MTVVLFTNLLSSSTQGQMLKFEFHRVPFGIHNSPKFFFFFFFFFFNCSYLKKYGTLHEFACHPCAGAMLIFSVSFQF